VLIIKIQKRTLKNTYLVKSDIVTGNVAQENWCLTWLEALGSIPNTEKKKQYYNIDLC
jgi:hypothetical protein